MASSQKTVEFICEQVSELSGLTYKKMFGEYALYLDDKIIASVCDDQLFVKPTPAGRELLGEIIERPPYPGAKPQFFIGDRVDDRELLVKLFRLTADALPKPKPKASKKAKTS